MVENISPEEKLFQIIQEGKNAPAESGKPKSAEIKKGVSGIKRFFAAFRKNGDSARKKGDSAYFSSGKIGAVPFFRVPIFHGGAASISLPLNLSEAELKRINKTLALFLAGLTIFAFYYLAAKRPDIGEVTREAAGVTVQMAKKEHVEGFKPLTFYMDWVQKRDIFQPAPEEKKEIEEKKKLPEKKLSELLSGFTLQGISWGETPKAIVKGPEGEEVYFLKEGQALGATGAKIKSITRDKVIVSCGDEEMELL